MPGAAGGPGGGPLQRSHVHMDGADLDDGGGGGGRGRGGGDDDD